MENLGRASLSPYTKEVRKIMFTISDMIADISRGCMTNNMIEDCFSYRIAFFINEGNKGKKSYIDTSFGELHKSLENIIRSNFSVTNSVAIAQTTALKNGKCVYLQSRSYSFSLNGYFKQTNGESKDRTRNGTVMYSRYAVR